MSQLNKSIRGKLFKYFSQKLILKDSTNGWKRTDCVLPGCDGKHTLGINIQLNKAKCFKCEQSVSLWELLIKLEKFSTLNEARSFIDVQQEYSRYEDFKVEEIERKKVVLPEGFRLLPLNPRSELEKSIVNYLKGRRFKIKNLILKSVGYCTEGEYAGYAVFPIYRKGELIFFQGRRFINKGPKMKNPKKEDFGVGKTEIIYNEDALYIYKRCRIVESLTNALTLDDKTIATLGKSLSKIQKNKILSSPVKYLDIILDNDALDKAIKLAMEFIHHKKIRLVIMPKEKDVNDLGKKATFKIIKESELVSYIDLIKLKNRYGSKAA